MKIPGISSILAGHLLALCATVLWSSMQIFAKILADRYSPIELSFWRWAVATAFFLPFVWRDVWAVRGVVRQHAVRLMIISLIGMVGSSLTLFLGARTTTATNMGLLLITAPLFIALICRFVFRELLSGQQITGLIIAAAGMAVLITRGDIVHLLSLSLTAGDLWVLAGALCFAIYSVLVRYRPPQLGLNVFLCIIMGMGVIWMLPLALWQWLFIKPLFRPTWAEVASLMHIGVMASTMAFLLWNKAVVLIGAVRAGVIYYCLPFSNYVLALIFLGERLALPQAVGGALIIGGVVFSSFQAILQAHAPKRN